MFFPGFPFGFSQGGQDQGEEQQQQSTQNNFYDILQVPQDATLAEITANFEQLSERYKPGAAQEDGELYEQVKQAFLVLSDSDKRKQYDASQLDKQNQMIGNMFGGQINSKNKQKQRPQMQPTKRVVEVPLEKIYNGGVVNLHHERARLCTICDGKGGENVKKCPDCKGEGATIQLVQMGPGMYTQMEKNCAKCSGMGELFDEGVKCKQCDGRKIVKKQVDLQVPIAKGVPPGEIITLEGQANEVPQARAGDLILVVQQTPHELFTRKGADLFYKKNISLIQALLGFKFTLKHLNNQQYTIYTIPGEIVGDHQKKVVRGLGMPFHKDDELRGNLIIEFKVQMPKRGELNADQLSVLSKVLPGKINARPTNEHYEMLQDFQKQHLNTNEQGGNKKGEEDDEQGGEGGIGCQPQ